MKPQTPKGLPFKRELNICLDLGLDDEVSTKSLTLFRAGSQPTYSGRGGGGFRPPLSSRPMGPEGPQK